MAALLSLLILLGSGFVWLTFNSLSSSVTVVPFNHDRTARTAPNIDGADQNVLIVGDDSRQGATAAELADIGTDYSAGDNTDTIMVLHLPADGRSASLMSFPRDALITLPGSQGTGKINSVYAAAGGDAGGGPVALADAITRITGLSIDHFLKIGMLGFYRVSKAVGGVDLNLCQAQNASTEGDASHPNGYSGIDLKQGVNRNVQGKQALAFVRQRHGPGLSDYTRVQRQRYFLAALFRKLGTPQNLANPLKIGRIISAVSSSLTVDVGLQGGKLLTLATQMRSLTAGRLALATIPMSGPAYQGSEYLGEQIDADAMPAFIAKFIGQPSKYEKATPASPASVSVTVIDGGRPAAASVTALTARGFHATLSQTRLTSKTTQIRYPDGMQAQAKALAAAVPGAVPVLTHTVRSVQLVLGTDQAHVLGLPAPAPTGSATSSNGGGYASSDPAVRTAADTSCVQ
ncbi:MAG: LCP family protein [Actinomycetota bacterium]|nr:LCP family protein [Actinomycetota bacterium]